MKTRRLSLLITFELVEYKVLRCTYSLASHIVRIHLLPSAWEGTAVEDHHEPVVVSVAEDGLIMSHCLLLVTSEEVHLDALDSKFMHPAHLLLS